MFTLIGPGLSVPYGYSVVATLFFPRIIPRRGRPSASARDASNTTLPVSLPGRTCMRVPERLARLRRGEERIRAAIAFQLLVRATRSALEKQAARNAQIVRASSAPFGELTARRFRP
jgi:hypothetical protein